jgi:hypothetical protein
MLLGWVGQLTISGPVGAWGVAFALVIAIIAMVREAGWVALPILQCKRQTRSTWAYCFPRVVAAMLWGLDLGMTFTTYLTFSGVWLLATVAVLTSQPGMAAVLFAAYWLGRALSVWIAPWLMADASTTPRFLDAILGQYQLMQRIHAVGLA